MKITGIVTVPVGQRATITIDLETARRLRDALNELFGPPAPPAYPQPGDTWPGPYIATTSTTDN